MNAEQYIGHVPDSSGKKVRTIQLDVPQSDGSIATVQLQVVNIRDENGDPLRTSDRDVLLAIYDEMRALRQMYGLATGVACFGPAPLDASADIRS